MKRRDIHLLNWALKQEWERRQMSTEFAKIDKAGEAFIPSLG